MEDSLHRVRCERVGRFEFSIAVTKASPEMRIRWSERSERLAAFLLRAWEDKQAERASA